MNDSDLKSIRDNLMPFLREILCSMAADLESERTRDCSVRARDLKCLQAERKMNAISEDPKVPE
jgi:hypothetical protein